ncbi:MAG TPA: nitrous oxide reductase accessory protein NosL [Blastocatellia bacterium]|nr:nitrous oxide reductase accessory protein NosL [Blastocatellia bacterium]
MAERNSELLLKIGHSRWTRLWPVQVWLAALLLAGCQRGSLEPVAIAPDDMCSFCRMAISEKRYAAEFIDSEGEAFKFDDITCMTSFIREMHNQGNIGPRFVMDFDAKAWLKADDAYYVQSTEIKTPMSGGIIAFKDQSRAKETADKYGGKLLRFNDVFN